MESQVSRAHECAGATQLKTPYRDGTTHVIFETLDFIARLAALVPKPRVNLTRLHGVFAPNSKHRAQVTPAKRGRGGQHAGTADPQERTPAECRAAMSWAQRLKRVFGIDIETCPACGGGCLTRGDEPHDDLVRAVPSAARQWQRLAWWQARGEMRVSGAVVGRVQGLNCRAGSLVRSDWRPNQSPRRPQAGTAIGTMAVIFHPQLKRTFWTAVR